MPIEWVRVRHQDLGGETDYPRTALAAAQRRGYFPVDDEPVDQGAEGEAPTEPAAAPAGPPAEQQPRSRRGAPATADTGSADTTTTSTKES